MHRRHFTGARNKFDLNDRVQVRILRKRLKISHRSLPQWLGQPAIPSPQSARKLVIDAVLPCRRIPFAK